jgi:hypothetical protein
LRIRPAAGVAAAAALVLLGGGVSAAMTGDPGGNPLSPIVSMVSRLTGHPVPSSTVHDQLVATVAAARTAAQQGKPAVAKQLLDQVQGQLSTLPADEQGDLKSQIDSVISAYPAAGSSTSSGSEADTDSGGVSWTGSQSTAGPVGTDSDQGEPSSGDSTDPGHGDSRHTQAGSSTWTEDSQSEPADGSTSTDPTSTSDPTTDATISSQGGQRGGQPGNGRPGYPGGPPPERNPGHR